MHNDTDRLEFEQCRAGMAVVVWSCFEEPPKGEITALDHYYRCVWVRWESGKVELVNPRSLCKAEV